MCCRLNYVLHQDIRSGSHFNLLPVDFNFCFSITSASVLDLCFLHMLLIHALFIVLLQTLLYFLG